MKYVFLYAGQGAQKVGMGKDFYEKYESYRNVVDTFLLSFDHKKIMHEGPLEELSKTEYTQPCMAVFAAGVTELLKEYGIQPDAALGLSLGEYGALYAANVFDYKEYVLLTAFRGKVMAEAAKGKECAMSAILGADADTVKAVCENHLNQGYVTVANYNCPGQYVICGDETAVTTAEAELKEKGAKRCIRLNVSGPFHTKYMKSAGDALKEYFEKVDFHIPEIPVLMNYTGDFYHKDEDMKQLLIAQVQNSVRLEESLKKILEQDVECFVEIGPGNILTGFLRKCAKESGKKVNVKTLENVDDFMKLLNKCEE